MTVIGHLKRAIERTAGVSLYRNAFYLMISPFVIAVLGFVFWVLAARIHSAEEVGLASATIAVASMLAVVANLGLGPGMIRYLPRADSRANEIVNSSLTLTSLVSIVAAVIFLAGLGVWSPKLVFLRENPGYIIAFIVFACANTLSILLSSTFVAWRRSEFFLANGLIAGIVKVPLLVLLVMLMDSFGIFASWGIALSVALLLCLFVFLPRVQNRYRPRITVRWGVLKEMMRFSFANYVANSLLVAPGFLFPLMVVNLAGAEANAYFYSAWLISSILFGLSTATSLSLFAEGSHDESALEANVRRAVKLTFLILVPGVVLIVALADKVLLAFGDSYFQNAVVLLRTLAAASAFVAVNNIFLGVMRVRKRLGVIVGLTSFLAIATLVLAYVLLPRLGISGVGVAFLASNGTVALLVVGAYSRWRRRSSPE